MNWVQWGFAQFCTFGMWWTWLVWAAAAWGWAAFGVGSKAVCAWLVARWWWRGTREGERKPEGV
jgi:hypothetical protein